MKKSLAVLIAPPFFNYYKGISKELLNYYEDVIYFDDRPKCSSFFKFCIRKRVPLLFDFLAEKNDKQIQSALKNKNIDTLIIIKGECISQNLVKWFKEEKKSEVIIYTWDSLHNNPGFYRFTQLADKAFTFDFLDAKNNNELKLLPLYSDIKTTNLNFVSDMNKFDVCFIGSYHADRAKVLNRFIKENSDFTYFFRIYFPSKAQYILYWILDRELRKLPFGIVTFTPTSKSDIQNIYNCSEAVLDIHNINQSGMTMRTLEVLSSGHRLITTNMDAIEYLKDCNISYLDRETGKITNLSPLPGEVQDGTFKYDFSLKEWARKLLMS
ncbi:hypothetical protein EKN56_16945 [Limnobaculum zhutongyuii]|uniref:Uncharacterized protein n=1 Tax=Limnobaculum zhutongyuii TaxID=2498113 RepID=A0A411WP76_9GAMM|nr:hypothetical protein [Limnobaculum zhutongyuii]QBH97930.1 hypothetical protein EKN56_16945 [Limnobaculum zhutongyuii]TQS88212.1 hypothetical protein ELQ32_11915 [Limnobaculum zhutongyuii]